MDKKWVDNDFCDLDPTKICDNCCRCIDDPELEARAVLVELDPFADEFVPDEVDVLNEPLEQPDIDPALLAEWEAKLRAIEEAEAAEAERTGAPGVFFDAKKLVDEE